MKITRLIVSILALIVAVYFTFLGISGHLPSWVGGLGWAFLAVEKLINMWTQRLINKTENTVTEAMSKLKDSLKEVEDKRINYLKSVLENKNED